ncbi:MAG: hypothetical protein AUK56_07220 [Thiomicrospira sp. CG2_30_44_34]|nr:MAG: hypothetical protein AUK56_07220 [Thiomicrospira sp. CG2_30_44_34]
MATQWRPKQIVTVFLMMFTLFACSEILAATPSQDWMNYGESMVPSGEQKVTFIELGADKCFSCRMMQPILNNLQTRYPKNLKVVFINVWQENGDIAGKKYAIRVIPTQIFYNAQGEEIFRHEGFFAENQIEALLKKHRVSQ